MIVTPLSRFDRIQFRVVPAKPEDIDTVLGILDEVAHGS
jgi:hypothetical protein